MESHIQQHIKENNNKLNDTDRSVLSVLAKYARKYPGAAHLKVDTICKLVNKSEATVRRTLRKLERLQLIKKIPTIREILKGFDANIIVLLPFGYKSFFTVREDEKKPVIPSEESSSTQKERDISKEQQIVNHLNGIFHSLTCRVTNTFPQFREHYENLGYQALIIALQATKHRKIHNLSDYYVRVFEKLCQQDLFEFFLENEGN